MILNATIVGLRFNLSSLEMVKSNDMASIAISFCAV